jgi:hypothetical protein
LFAAFPFAGLAYSVWPISDITAVALCLLCQLSFVRGRWKSFAVCAACALMVHKVMWFFVPCLMLAAWVTDRKSRPVVPLAVVPLATWVVAGAIHYQDALWFLRWGVEHLVVSRSALPVLDGLIGPFLTGDLNKVLKGCLILGIVATALAILYHSWRRGDWLGTSIAAMLVLVATIMNQYEVWVVARYSKLLMIPLAVTLSHRAIWNRVLDDRVLFGALLFASIGTNVAFSYYMARFFL